MIEDCCSETPFFPRTLTHSQTQTHTHTHKRSVTPRNSTCVNSNCHSKGNVWDYPACLASSDKVQVHVPSARLPWDREERGGDRPAPATACTTRAQPCYHRNLSAKFTHFHPSFPYTHTHTFTRGMMSPSGWWAYHFSVRKTMFLFLTQNKLHWYIFSHHPLCLRYIICKCIIMIPQVWVTWKLKIWNLLSSLHWESI